MEESVFITYHIGNNFIKPPLCIFPQSSFISRPNMKSFLWPLLQSLWPHTCPPPLPQVDSSSFAQNQDPSRNLAPTPKLAYECLLQSKPLPTKEFSPAGKKRMFVHFIIWKVNIVFVEFKHVDSDSSFQQIITKGLLSARQWARSWDHNSKQNSVPVLNELNIQQGRKKRKHRF